MRNVLFVSIMALFSSAATAELSISNNVISWPDDGWYQVQNAHTYEEVCGGGSSCEVPAGTYNVINQTTGQRYTDILIRLESDALVVQGNKISWPDDGWYQVQTADTFLEVCAGGRSCDVAPGMYVVINHSTGVRTENIAVGDGEEASLEVASRPTVSGNTISWADDGWYQVQAVDTNEELCGGGQSCIVSPGVYNVINHSTGERFESLVVAGPTVSGNVISWTDDGWHQVQTVGTHIEVCGGGRSCEVEPGVYRVINHSTGERFDDVVVAQTSADPIPEPMPSFDSEFNVVVSGMLDIELMSSVTVSGDEAANDLVWSVLSQPSGSDMLLEISLNGQRVSFIPYYYGNYVIDVSSQELGVSQQIPLYVAQEFEYEIEMIKGYSDDFDPELLSAPITNQIWIASSSASEAELRDLVVSISDAFVVGFNDVSGLLVEISSGDEQTISQLEQLGDLPEIDSVFYNYHHGSLVDRLFYTADRSRYTLDPPSEIVSLVDRDSNWHLTGEYGIKAEAAWAVTTGDTSVKVGISEPFFFQDKHDELIGRIAYNSFYVEDRFTIDNKPSDGDDCVFYFEKGKELDACVSASYEVTPKQYAGLLDHGTGVAGIIGGRDNDDAGSGGQAIGINHVSKMSFRALGAFSGFPYDLGGDSSVKIINYSWGELQEKEKTSYPLFGDPVTTIVPVTFEDSYASTRKWRQWAKGTSNSKLHVWAAGNDGVDARTQNGSIHYDGKLDADTAIVDRLDNVIVVGSIGSDGSILYNYGDTIDIYAPSVFLAPFVNELGVIENGKNSRDGYSDNFNGTSASAPIVSGVASLVYSLASSQELYLSPNQVKTILIDSARVIEIGERPGSNNILLVDAEGALNETLETYDLVNPGLPYIDSVSYDELLAGVPGTIEVFGNNFTDELVFQLGDIECRISDFSESDRTQLELTCEPQLVGLSSLQIVDTERVYGRRAGVNRKIVLVSEALSQDICLINPTNCQTVDDLQPNSIPFGSDVLLTLSGMNLTEDLMLTSDSTSCVRSEIREANQIDYLCSGFDRLGEVFIDVVVEREDATLRTFTVEVIELEVSSPTVTNVEPSEAVVGVEQSFTITGTNLPSTISAFLGRPGTCSIDSFSPIKVVTVCTPVQSGNQNLALSSADNTFALAGSPVSITVSEPVVVPVPSVTNVEPRTATVGEAQSFTITGTNLPSTITAFLGRPGTCSIDSFSPIEVVTVCTPVQSGNQNLAFSSEDSTVALAGSPVSITVSEPVVIPVEPDVMNVEPRTATVGVPQSFTITGTNLPSTITAFLGRPGTCSIDTFSPIEVVTVCTPVQSGNQNLALSSEDTTVALAGSPVSITVSEPVVVPVEPDVTNVEPRTATVGEAQSFTITGTNLPSTITAFLGRPGTCSISSVSSTEVVAVCTPVQSGNQNLALSSEDTTVALAGSPVSITVFEPVVVPVEPDVTNVEPRIATVGEEQSFTITGTNLPSTITAFLGRPGTCSIDSVSSTEVVTVCTPVQSGNQNLAISSADAVGALPGTPVSIAVSEAEVVPVEPVVISVSPTTVTEGERVRFEIMGSNFPEDVAVAIWNTSDCAWVSGSESQLLVDCTINNVQPGRPIIRVLVGPNDVNAGGEIFYRDGQPFVADTEEFSGSPIIFVAIDLPVISSVIPLVATVGEEVTFNISGTDLFNTTAVTLGESVSCSYVALSEFEVRAECIPETAGVQSLTVDGGDIAASITSPFEIEVAEPVTAPVLSGGVNITDITGGFRINSQTATGTVDEYRFYRSTSAGSLGNRISAGTTNSYSDTGLIDGTTYYYTIEACNDAACDSSSQDSNTYVAPVSVPTLAGGVNITDITGGFSINSQTASGVVEEYRFYRSTSSGTLGTQISVSRGNSYNDRAIEITDGVTYYYTIEACNSAGCVASNQDFKTYVGASPTLSGGVNITDITGGFSINSQTATGLVDEYRFYRSTISGTDGVLINAGSSNSYNDTDTGLVDGTTYYYSIAACNSVGCFYSRQDFKTYFASGSGPSVSSISPTQANEGEPIIFTIFGHGLSPQNEVMFNTAGICLDSITAAADGSSIQVECLPMLEGARVVIVKEQPNGSIISGAELEVEVGPYILDPIIYSATPVSAIVGVATGFEITYRDAAFNLMLEGGTCDNYIYRGVGETNFSSIIQSENRHSSVTQCIPGETGTKLLQVVDIINGDVIDGGEFYINVQNNDAPITTEPGQFSDWINFSVYQTEFNMQADIGNYPVTVNGRCNNGEPEYRGQFVYYYSGRYSQWSSHHHLTESEYSSLRSILLSEGYRATYEQNILCGGVQRYQGTWVLD